VAKIIAYHRITVAQTTKATTYFAFHFPTCSSFLRVQIPSFLDFELLKFYLLLREILAELGRVEAKLSGGLDLRHLGLRRSL
jgi:hypothetical protein